LILNARLGGKTGVDCTFHPLFFSVVRRVEELETYDLERQLHFEEVLLRSLRYEAFKPTTLDSLALKSIE
jgi:hypothetical protein